MFRVSNSVIRSARALLRFVSAYNFHWHFFAALQINLLSLAVPLMMLQVYDRIIPRQSFSTLALLVMGVMSALCIEVMLRMARTYATSQTAARSEDFISQRAMSALLHKPTSFFHGKDIAQRMQDFSAIGRLREFYSGHTASSLADLPFILMFIGMMALIGGWLAVIPVMLITFLACTGVVLATRMNQFIRAREKADHTKLNRMLASFVNLSAIKAAGYEKKSLMQLENEQAETSSVQYNEALLSGLMATSSAFFVQLNLLLVVSAGGAMAVYGYMSVGALSACTLLAGRCLQPVQRLLTAWSKIQDLKHASMQVQSLLAYAPHGTHNRKLSRPAGNIILNNITFKSGGIQILRSLTSRISAGSTLHINGSAASGKSVLLKLIAGALQPTSGHVWCDGHDPAKFSGAELYRHIGYLPQNALLFTGSVLDNITGFSEDEQVKSFALKLSRQLGLEDVVHHLADGYATQINGLSTDMLSSGFRQRIALVRAMRFSPRILLLDEPDLDLDGDGYMKLYDLIKRAKTKTTFVIATSNLHLSSLADEIMTLNKDSSAAFSQLHYPKEQRA